MNENLLAVETPGSPIGRRALLKVLAGLGIGTATFHRALAAQAQDAKAITPEMIKQSEWIAGLELTDAERDRTAKALQRSLSSIEALRKVEVGYDVPPAISFLPSPGLVPAEGVRRNQAEVAESNAAKRPDSEETLAFLPVTELAALIRSRQVTSTELTKLYLGRLRKFDPLLKCVVTFTEDLAMKQAARADAEIAAGLYRGPLAWDSLGRQGSDRLSRLSHHVGCNPLQGPGDRRKGHRGRADWKKPARSSSQS